MSLNVGSLWASLSLNISNFTAGLAQASVAASQASASMSQSFGSGPQKSLGSVSKSVNQITEDMKTAEGQVKKLNKQFGFFGKDVRRIVGGILVSQTFYRMANAINETISSVMWFQNEIQSAGIAMEYFLGSQEKAEAFLNVMKDFAAVTPYTFKSAMESSRRLLAMGFQPESVKSVMQIMTDAAAATGAGTDQIDRIVLALGQMKTKSHVVSQELRQLAEAGIPAFKILQEELGLTNDQLANIGDYKISGDIGVAAILKGLEKRYKGAAERIAETMKGMMSTIRDDFLDVTSVITSGWYKSLEGIVRKVRDSFRDATKILRERGIGGWFESVFPPELQASIKSIIAGMKSIWQNVKMVWEMFKPILGALASTAIRVLGVIIPMIANVSRFIINIQRAIMQTAPWLKIFGQMLIGLLVANLVSKALIGLYGAMKLTAVAAYVAKAVSLLTRAIQGLYIVCTKNPIIGVITLISAALLSLALSSKTVSAWLDNLMVKLASLAGFDLGGMLQPEDDVVNAWVDQYNKSLEDMQKDLKNVGKDAETSGKKVKDKFVASFDELYQIPDNLDKIDDEFAGMIPDLSKIPDFKLPTLDTPAPEFGNQDEEETKKLIILPEIQWPQEPPNMAPVTEAIATVESMAWALKAALEPTLEKTVVWATNMGLEFAKVGQAVENFFVNLIPDAVNSFATGIQEGFVTAQEVINGFVVSGVNALVQFDVQGAIAISTFATNIVTSFVTWTNNTYSSIKTWVTSTYTTVSTWVSQTASSLADWAINTGTSIATWSLDTAASFASWSLNVGTAIADWSRQTITDIGTWIGVTTSNFCTWVSNTVTNIKNWSTQTATAIKSWAVNTATNLYNWGVNTGINIATWVNNAINSIGEWVISTSGSIANWVNTTATNISSWATNVMTNFGQFANETAAVIGDWANTSWKTFTGWLSGTARAVSSWARNVLDTIVSWASKAWEVIGELAEAAGESIGRFSKRIGSGIREASLNLGSFVAENKSWVIPVAATAVVVGGIAAVASGGALAPVLAPLLALERGGFVDEEQLVRMGEGNKREVTIPLENRTYMRPYAQAVAAELLEAIGGSGISVNKEASDRQILYVGTLIADERSLKELERKMHVIRLKEASRTGGNAYGQI